MEELSYEETLKLQNSKEHLQNVLSNLRIANSDLTKALSDISSSKIQLEDLKRENDLLVNANTEIRLSQAMRNQELDNREFIISQRENSIMSEEKEYREAIYIFEQRIEHLKIVESSCQSKIERTLSEAQTKIDINNKTLEVQSEQIKLLENEIKDKSKIRKEQEDAVDRLFIVKQEAEIEIERFRKNSEKEMKDITTQIELEKEKIKNPRLLLERENTEIERKKRNNDVMDRRLKKQFSKLHPDINITI